MLVKCIWCKNKQDKNDMVCEEKTTGKFNKNGTEKKIRKYFHKKCYDLYLQDKEKKRIEASKFDELYQYLLKLHSLDVLNGRMIEKIQDLRNGSVKVKNHKIVRYKQGIPYELMYQTYQYINNRIDYVLTHNQFQTKWNEFSYVFGMVINNLNEVKSLNKRKQQQEIIEKDAVEPVEINIHKTVKKKDEMDISDFL